MDTERDYYADLGLNAEATDEEIRAAYRSLVRKYHPDGSAKDTGQFRLVQEAYEALRDPAARAAYDRQRRERAADGDAPVVLRLVQSRSTMHPMDAPQMLYVVLDLRAPETPSESQRRLNLALVIDRSTSMKGARMQYVKAAALELLDSLSPADRLSIVTFSDRAEVPAPSDYVSRTREFRSAIAAIVASGGTEIFQGLDAGLDQVRRYASDAYINHVLLLTDGRTYGDEVQALAAARSAHADNIGVSAFGIGDDWNDAFLDRLTSCGGGTPHYVDSPNKVRSALLNQVHGLAGVVLRDVTVRASPVPYAKMRGAYRVAPSMQQLEWSADGRLSIGQLSAADPTVIVVEIEVQQTGVGERRVVALNIDAIDAASGQPFTLKREVLVSFLTDFVEEPVSPRVLNYLSRLSVFQLQEKAWQAADAGDIVQASRYLESAATRLFDMGYRELGQAAMQEVGRLTQGIGPSVGGRKKLRYETRSLSVAVT